MKSLVLAAALCTATICHAQEIGDWYITDMPDNKSVLAASMNESGGILGKSCAVNGCVWFVTFKTVTCESGARYPALLNAETAAWHITLMCTPNEANAGRYVILEAAKVDDAALSSSFVGIAVPMREGFFRVSRFAVRGWPAAAKALGLRAANIPRKTGESTL